MGSLRDSEGDNEAWQGQQQWGAVILLGQNNQEEGIPLVVGGGVTGGLVIRMMAQRCPLIGAR